MTKEDIKKALELCIKDEDCVKCPYCDRGCTRKLRKDSFALIIEQEKEIERLKEEKKQAQIDVLNKVQEHLFFGVSLGFLRLYVDGLIRKVENDKDKG